MTRILLSAASLLALGACTGPKPDTADSHDDCLVGCGDSDSQLEDIPAPDTLGLSETGGCSDLLMYAGDPSGELILVFSTTGVAQAAYEAATLEASVELDLATEGSLELWQGTSVTNIPCNDALYGDEEVVTSWIALEGSATVSVESEGVHEAWDAYPGTATLVLQDVVLSAEGAEDASIESLGWSAYVGWLPG